MDRDNARFEEEKNKALMEWMRLTQAKRRRSLKQTSTGFCLRLSDRRAICAGEEVHSHWVLPMYLRPWSATPEYLHFSSSCSSAVWTNNNHIWQVVTMLETRLTPWIHHIKLGNSSLSVCLRSSPSLLPFPSRYLLFSLMLCTLSLLVARLPSSPLQRLSDNMPAQFCILSVEER